MVRDASGTFLRIVEQKDATPEEAAIKEINTGCYAFDCRGMFDALKQVRLNNKQGEYYLTDVPGVLKAEGAIGRGQSAVHDHGSDGVNTRAQLAEVGPDDATGALDRLMAETG